MHTENKLREGLPPLPDRIKSLPVDDRGYPVPWFVAWVDGKPEFRAADPIKKMRAIQEHRCWVCGEKLGKHLTFVIGPMCAINRISGEPPCHLDCAIFSATACPFLTKPQMVRRTNGMPEGATKDDGHLDRNPGVTMLWTTFSYSLVRTDNSFLFSIGDPVEILCYREGRRAFDHEIRHSIDTGLPLLLEEAERQSEKDEVFRRRNAVYQLLGC